MPQVRFAPGALRDLERLREFLRPKNPAAAKRAALAIIKTIQLLKQHPQIGRPADEADPESVEAHGQRELMIDFGGSGYVALYQYEDGDVTVLALRHQREAGY